MPKILHSLLPKSLHFWLPFTEISEKTLDDAFDCVIYRDKYFIYAGGAPSDQKKAMADEAEASRKLVKEAFKSGLKVKRV